MGGPKYIFRVDDVAHNMNWDNFNRLKNIFVKYNVKPLIGVIPDDKDECLKNFGICPDSFWDQIRYLHLELDWTVALHGYNHLYSTVDPGILKINRRSEFAGLSRKEQNEKIVRGKQKLEAEQLKISAFMAPAHTFDKTTLKVLIDNNIRTITDGFGIYPYKRGEITFIPQLFANPRKMPFGIYTWCMHPNTFTESNFRSIEDFIQKNSDNIITFNDAEIFMTDKLWQCMLNLLVEALMSARFRIRLVLKA